MAYEYFKTHPLRVPKNQRLITIAQMRAAEKSQTDGVAKVHPGAGAYIHYGGVELADKLVILQPTASDDEIAALQEFWNASCGFVCRHLLFYTWQIITKELRHGSHSMCKKAFGPMWSDDPYAQLTGKICDSSNYLAILDQHGSYEIGPYVDAVEKHFRKGGWGGAFGGKKWADIALQIKMYLDGETSAMIAADRCWTLVHNTGPIFNKGFYFHHHGASLMKVLNAQATTSVFDLKGDPYEDTPHPCYAAFETFKELATKVIQRAEPDYHPGKGATGNTVAVPTGGKNHHKGGGSGLVSLGTYDYETTTRDEDNDA